MSSTPGGEARSSPAKIEIDLELLLPDSPDERDGCRQRLAAALAGLRGVTRSHLEDLDGSARLCVHYDPGLVSLAGVERLARRAGAQIAARYRHERIAIEGMDCSDCTLAIEHALGRAPGVLAASGPRRGDGARERQLRHRAARREHARRRLQLLAPPPAP